MADYSGTFTPEQSQRLSKELAQMTREILVRHIQGKCVRGVTTVHLCTLLNLEVDLSQGEPRAEDLVVALLDNDGLSVSEAILMVDSVCGEGR